MTEQKDKPKCRACGKKTEPDTDFCSDCAFTAANYYPNLYPRAAMVLYAKMKALVTEQQDIAALFVETGGAYFSLPGVDPWDEPRDARTYQGSSRIVAHPPCERWGGTGTAARPFE